MTYAAIAAILLLGVSGCLVIKRKRDEQEKKDDK